MPGNFKNDYKQHDQTSQRSLLACGEKEWTLCESVIQGYLIVWTMLPSNGKKIAVPRTVCWSMAVFCLESKGLLCTINKTGGVQ